MVSTEYYEIVDAIWSLFSGVVNDGATDGVVHLSTLDYTVFDGLPGGEDYPDYTVFVGWDADPEGSFQSATVNQEWAGPIGNLRRDETIDVVCALIAHYGDADRWKPVRDAALLIQTDLETKLRNAPDLNLGVNGVRQYIVAQFRPLETFMEPYSASGYWFRLTFTVSVKTRI